jgi:prevent-host-death family protein
MSTHSVAEAKNKLPELIDRVLKGEGVVITRHGRPVVELKPIPEAARPISSADLDWLVAHRASTHHAKDNAGKLLTRLRDEDER